MIPTMGLVYLPRERPPAHLKKKIERKDQPTIIVAHGRHDFSYLANLYEQFDARH